MAARINAKDFLDDGMQIEDGKKIAKYLESIGIDAVSISSGTYSCQDVLIESQITEEGWRQNAFLKDFKDFLTIPILAANHIKRPATAEKMLKDKVCDCVLLGRQSMADPNWAKKAQEGKADQIRYCISCNYCTEQVVLGKPVKCSVNPCLSNESIYNENTLKKDGNGRQIVIIGGGPADMEAALLASIRGFRVTLFEKSGKLGGAIGLPRIAHGMSKVGYSVDAFVSRIMASDVEIVMNTEIKSYEQVASLKLYAVVIATGGLPAKFNIPGIEQENVVQAVDVLRTPENYVNKNVVLVGSGMTGLETAEVLADHGCSVSLFEMQDEIAKNANAKNKYAVLNYLLSKGVQVHLNCKLNDINNETIEFENLDEQKKETYTADIIVLSMGVKPNSAIVEELKGKVSNLITAGDCSDGRLVVHATSKAFTSIWNLE